MTTANILSQLGSPGVSTGFKNRIINGAMVIDQRAAGASVTTPTTGAFTYATCDRWAYFNSQASKFTIQQVSTSGAVDGFTNDLGITSTSAYSVLTGDYFTLSQAIEGYNIADLNWGTANAKTVTLSFRVYSSLTGTFGGSITNSANTRSYPFIYSIPVAGTWTTISVTIAGDTTGTWLTTNGKGMIVIFGFGVGSTYSGTAGSWSANQYFSATGATSVVGTNGATFYITGVQLEVGTTATNFDYRSIGTELALCQRYYETSWYGAVVGTDSSTVAQTGGYGINSTDGTIVQNWRVNKRTAPTCYVWSPLTTTCANKVRQGNNGTIATVSSVNTWGNVFTIASNGTTGYTFQYGWSADSEL